MNDFSKLPYRPCAGIMLANRKGEVFAGQRLDAAQSKYPDAWQMPQGGIDDGEDAETAAIRELWEETGVIRDHVEIIARSKEEHFYDLPDELVGKVWKGKYRGQKQIWFALRFEGLDGDIDIQTKHPEFSRWKWVDLEETIDLIVPFKRDLYQEIVNQFKRLV